MIDKIFNDVHVLVVKFSESTESKFLVTKNEIGGTVVSQIVPLDAENQGRNGRLYNSTKHDLVLLRDTLKTVFEVNRMDWAKDDATTYQRERRLGVYNQVENV